MRSRTGLVAAALFLLLIPIALVGQILVEDSADFTIHLVVGVGSLLLALAMRDFGLDRRVTYVGTAAAAAFGSIFLLQALSQIAGNAALSTLAFDVLGQEIERFLPDVILLWFVALLAWGTAGWSRVFGAAVMAIIVVVEAASLFGPLVGIEMESQKVLFLAPFAWLLIESLQRAPGRGTAHPRLAPQASQPAS